MNGLRYPQWQQPLQDAILAAATPQYGQKLADAKVIVRARLHAIEGQGSLTEQQALCDALRTIQELER